jgi:ubiquinone/menaquinone biosynthesis C-methylase UbiE
LEIRDLPYEDLRRGSALAIPWNDQSFDMVFSHGVLHHIPDIHTAQTEIRRVLRPNGTLIAMVYARNSLNYQVSIKVLRRLALLGAYALRRTRLVPRSPILQQHLVNAEADGVRNYLKLDNFTHRNTDGPLNPYARVYSRKEVVEEFSEFELTQSYSRYMHAPPLPVHGLPGARWLGWHLWLHLRARPKLTGDSLSDSAYEEQSLR